MSHRAPGSLVALMISMAFLVMPVAGQQTTPSHGSWSPPQTPWGHPDLQGTWTNTTTTPLERPPDLAEKEMLTDEERAIRNPIARISTERVSPASPTGGYNDFWLEQGDLHARTALLVTPPDGRLPPVTPIEQKRQSGRTDSYIGSRFDSWKDFNAYDRCITRGLPGAMMPGFYNHNYQILQTPSYVAVLVEMIHDVRIIPLDGRSHLSPAVRQWLGDSRGYWDGSTLVVETTNFSDKVQARFFTVFSGDEQLRLVERFTRIDADTVDYQVTVSDPTIWTGPWTASIPMFATEGPIFEYACHEGNYGLPNILAGARAAETERPQ